MSAKRRGLVVGGVLGAVAAGVAAGVAAERLAIGRKRLRPDPEAREAFGRLSGEERTVLTEDGVALHVEVSGSGPLTVVFVHGWAISSGEWHYQQRDLADVARLVTYDHRDHGESARSEADRHTISQLGHDLGVVLDAVAPEGPVVLVGHSMGGMTIMALARHRPDLFGERVVGVVLIGTSAGRVIEVLLRLPVRATGLLSGSVLPRVHGLLTKNRAAVERSRRVGSDLAYLITRLFVFGDNASPAQVEFTERMTAAVPLDVMTSYSHTFFEHKEYDSLATLGRVPVLVIVGSHDKVTPLQHSKDIVDRIPGAELVVLEGAGHMVNFERAPLVNLHLRAFLRRIVRGSRSARGA